MSSIADVVKITVSKQADQSLAGQVKGARKRYRKGSR